MDGMTREQRIAVIKAWLVDQALEPHGKAWSDSTNAVAHYCLAYLAHTSRARAYGVEGDRDSVEREVAVMVDAMLAQAQFTANLLATGDTEPPQWRPSDN